MINYFEPNVVVIDDVREEIQGIFDYYSNQGIGCKVFNPDLFDGDNPPSSPYSDVNVIYLDLFYSEKFDPELCSGWIRQIIKPKSFYILVLWTKDESNAKQVSDLLDEHCCTPFKTVIKNKTSYFATDGYNFTSLFNDLNNELNNVPALEEILIWKQGIKYAHNEIIGNLTKKPEAITDKLKKIIIGHGGESVKTILDSNHKRNILFDALDIVLVANTKKSILIPISPINETNIYDLSSIPVVDIDSELNSWFHFKLEDNISDELILPGLLSEFKESIWKGYYSIKDDDKIKDFLSKQTDPNTISKEISLVISRPCDIAQKKYGKNIKLLSGLQIIKPIRKSNDKKEFQKGSSNIDSIKIYDHLHFNETETDVTLLFDLRYVFSVPEKAFVNDFKNIKILNKELFSEIQVEYSSYSSRLGITQII